MQLIFNKQGSIFELIFDIPKNEFYWALAKLSIINGY